MAGRERKKGSPRAKAVDLVDGVDRVDGVKKAAKPRVKKAPANEFGGGTEKGVALSADERLVRLRIVHEAVLDGYSEAEIADKAASLWPESFHELPAMLDSVAGAMREAARQDMEVLHGYCLSSARRLQHKCTQTGDYSAALKAIKLQHDMASKGVPGTTRQKVREAAGALGRPPYVDSAPLDLAVLGG